jgi:alpha-galactosidase
MGWSSFSEQTVSINFLTQTNIQAQSDALQSSGLQSHGFSYINIDNGWQGSFDPNGRPTPSTSLFPDIASLIAHIHSNGQKAGIYWTPGVSSEAVTSNSQILNTAYHINDILTVPYSGGNTLALAATGRALPNYKIDFSKPGAQEYIDSIVELFASWGVDYIRLDAVSPTTSSQSIDNRPDVEAWGSAIAKSRRPIWLTLSSALNQDYLNTWEQYSNARRIDSDIECEGSCGTITNWALTSQRMNDLVGWENNAGLQAGWNDLGSLEVGNTTVDGLNPVEQQAAVTFWAMANAPMYLGGDLTALDSVGLQLLTNDEVLAVDQSGSPAGQIAGGVTPIWAGNAGDGSFYVALFNLNAFPSPVTIKWSMLGFKDAPNVRDLWNHADLGRYDEKFSAIVLGHGTRLLKVTPEGVADRELSQGYEAELARTHGQAVFSTCKTCSGQNKVMKLGIGADSTITFDNVYADKAGTYRMEVNPAASGPGDLFFQVDDEAPNTLKVGGGSVNLPSSTIIPVKLKAGYNSILFGNPTTVAPDLDRIAIIGEGFALPPTSTAYEAEVAQLSGTEYTSYCQYCSGGSKVASLDQSEDNAVTFPNVSAIAGDLYELEVDYVTSGQHSLFMRINDGDEIELDLNGSSSVLPSSIVIPISLKAGTNKIRFSGHEVDAPALDRIAVAPILGPVNLTTSLIAKSGANNERVWKLDVANSGEQPAQSAQINTLSLIQAGGQGRCQPKVVGTLPLDVGNIPKHDHKTIAVPLDFSKCPEDARFNVTIVFSSDNGALVGNTIGTAVSK